MARTAARNMYEIIEKSSAIDSSSTHGLQPSSNSFMPSIELEDVSFKYKSRPEIDVLKQVSMNVQPGEVVAIVGSSGSGKSTIVQLIQRFHDSTSGYIRVGGHDIRSLNVSWLRDHMAVVGQEPILFEGTIFENIKLGIKNVRGQTDGEIENLVKSAAVESNADDFITDLPSGYDTMVGERGCQLSGGQKQRIAIARALISSPSILLMDEATSALDRHSESLVQEAISALKSRRKTTIVIVAHRLSTIKTIADRIVVIEKGKLVEEGTHEALMKIKNGFYRKLFNQQLSSVDDTGENTAKGYGGQSEQLNGHLSNKSNRPERTVENEIELQTTAGDVESKPPTSWTGIFKLIPLNDKYLTVVGVLTSILFGLHIACYAVLFGAFSSILQEESPNLMSESSIKISVYFLLIAVTTGLTSFTTIVSFGLISQRLTLNLRIKMFWAILNQPTSWFDHTENSVGNLSSKLQDDTSTVHFVSGTMTYTVVQSVVSMSACVFLSLYLNWKMGLFVLLFVPLLLLSSFLYMVLSEGMILTDDEMKQKSVQMIQEVTSNITTVTSLNRQKYFISKFNLLVQPQLRSRIKQSHYRGLIIGFVASIGTISYGCTFLFGSYLISTKQLRYQDFVVIVEALIFGCVVLADSAIFSVDFKRGKEAVIRLLEIINSLPGYRNGENDLRPSFHGDIELKDVSFQYPNRDMSVLNDVNLKIESGSSLALVGSSGSGKSTLIQLLLKLYKPTSGKITMSGIDIQETDTSYLRSKMGLVCQEPMLFSSSIRYNIEYGLNSRSDTLLEEVIEAAMKAKIHSFIMTLPKKYDTIVGQRGSQLSGGQKQRVSIARVLLRNPKLILLDEATSSLDTVTESQIQQSLDDSIAGRSSVTVAHRLSTVKNCDKICVFDSGRLIEQGDHDQLMTRKGKYYQVYTNSKDIKKTN